MCRMMLTMMMMITLAHAYSILCLHIRTLTITSFARVSHYYPVYDGDGVLKLNLSFR